MLIQSVADGQRHAPECSRIPVRTRAGARFHLNYEWRCFRDEKNIPAEEASARKGAWLPQENVDLERQKGSCPSPCEGQSEAVPLIKEMDRPRRSIFYKHGGDPAGFALPERRNRRVCRGKKFHFGPSGFGLTGRPRRPPAGVSELCRGAAVLPARVFGHHARFGGKPLALLWIRSYFHEAYCFN